MARSKQANPVRRELSSEYISKHDRSPANGSALANGSANGNNANAGSPVGGSQDAGAGNVAKEAGKKAGLNW